MFIWSSIQYKLYVTIWWIISNDNSLLILVIPKLAYQEIKMISNMLSMKNAKNKVNKLKQLTLCVVCIDWLSQYCRYGLVLDFLEPANLNHYI